MSLVTLYTVYPGVLSFSRFAVLTSGPGITQRVPVLNYAAWSEFSQRAEKIKAHHVCPTSTRTPANQRFLSRLYR